MTAPSPESSRAQAVRRITLFSLATNFVLSLAQIAVGIFAHAFSLIADASHTLADIVADLVVLFAAARAARPADPDHPYGHGRIETAASLFLGALLVVVGAGFLWAAGERLQMPADQLPTLHPGALFMALCTLLAKEALFRFGMRAGKRLDAPVLIANAWHARSDAASSLVVAIGIGGSLLGAPFLEPLGAALVGFLILIMGLKIGRRALGELIDTGLPPGELARIEATVRAVPGVLDMHELRTRRMSSHVLCDLHVLVAPRLSVTEGHAIADAVWASIHRAHPHIDEVLVHIDTENDLDQRTPAPHPPPARGEFLAASRRAWGEDNALSHWLAAHPEQLQLHYRERALEALILLPATGAPALAQPGEELFARLHAQLPTLRHLSFYRENDTP